MTAEHDYRGGSKSSEETGETADAKKGRVGV